VHDLRYDPRFIAIAKRLADDLKDEVMKARMPPAPIIKQVAV
jgi:hypothetical protein